MAGKRKHSLSGPEYAPRRTRLVRKRVTLVGWVNNLYVRIRTSTGFDNVVYLNQMTGWTLRNVINCDEGGQFDIVKLESFYPEPASRKSTKM